MNFTKRDIERVANGRVNDKESKASNIWNMGAVAGLVLGWIVLTFTGSKVVGVGISTVSVIAFAYYWFNVIPKKQKPYASQLWAEYQKEQVKK